MVGGDGLRMLLLSVAVIAVTGGLAWVWQYRRVWVAAHKTSVHANGDLLVVLGMQLRKGKPRRLYVKRLERALALMRSNPAASVLILGGRTGNSPISEAEAGRQFLVHAGVDERLIRKEEASRHTLENLRQARVLFAEMNEQDPVFITSRFHLARTRALAHGLGIPHSLCAAEERNRINPSTLIAMAREAFFLNWYLVGRNWSQWTKNAASLQRIT